MTVRPWPDTYDVLGVPISVVTLESATEAVLRWAREGMPKFITCPDVSNIVRAQSDPGLMHAHHRAAMVSPDGMPLVWLGRAAGFPVRRACGPDLMASVIRSSVGSGIRHYLYGGKPGVSVALKASLDHSFIGADIIAADPPPFRPLTHTELDDLIADIRTSGTHIVWIGISSPKQELLMEELVGRADAVFVGVGAAFDFHSGATRRAPKWMQRWGLEWIFRFASEPKRLWKRYLVMAPKFILLVIRGKLTRKPGPATKSGHE